MANYRKSKKVAAQPVSEVEALTGEQTDVRTLFCVTVRVQITCVQSDSQQEVRSSYEDHVTVYVAAESMAMIHKNESTVMEIALSKFPNRNAVEASISNISAENSKLLVL